MHSFLYGNSGIGLALMRTTIAWVVAIAGGAIGAGLTKTAARRLNFLVYTAMGMLLFVTVIDILPEAKADLSWPEFGVGIASGIALFWLVSKYIYHICPSCAIHTFDDAALQRLGQTAVLFMVALGIHSTMDGLAVVVGDQISGKPNLYVLLGVTIHKLPEGMALALLLIGAGYSPMRSFVYTVLIEATTELGALVGIFLLHGLSPEWLGFIFAHVGGGFLYLVGTTLSAVKLLRPAAVHEHEHEPGHAHEGH